MEKRLLHKYFRGETSIQEELEIIEWVESSTKNRQEYLKERKIWNALLLYPTIKNNKNIIQKRFHIFHYISIAASFLIIFSIGIYTWFKYSTSQQVSLSEIIEPTLVVKGKQNINLTQKSFSIQNRTSQINNNNKNNLITYKKNSSHDNSNKAIIQKLLIPHGKTYKLLLSDGTEVVLNAETVLEFPSNFGNNIREVKLKGEAFFKVKPDNNKPFIVHTNHLDIKVLGTSFNISSYPQENQIKTTLVEGSVQINHKGEKQLIAPSEQYIYNKVTHLKQIKVVNTELYTSWIHNKYIFEDTTLKDILAQISHWFKFETQYENEDLKEKRFTFSIDRGITLDQLIQIINNTHEIYIEKINNIINIKKRR